MMRTVACTPTITQLRLSTTVVVVPQSRRHGFLAIAGRTLLRTLQAFCLGIYCEKLFQPQRETNMRSNGIHPLMKMIAALAVLCLTSVAVAQQQSSVVPSLINFSGVLADANGKPLTGVVGVTFYLYAGPEGGAPLWMETQNVQPDKYGDYSVMLGSTTGQGLPTSLFVSGEARWLGVQAQGQAEQPRVMLLAVPYALKAGDAQTIGGMPASAFALAGTSIPGTSGSGGHGTASSNVAKNGAQTVAGGGTTGYLAEWTSATNLGNSLFFQSSAGNLGIATTAPSQKFEVDLGNLLARGANNFTKSGNTAFLYVGDTNHLVEASYGGGLTLGAYEVPQGLFISDVTGKVGLGTGTPTQKFEVDLGNILARGTDNFQKSGDTAFVYVGDVNHPIEALFNGGLALGAYKFPQALYIQDNTGNIGIGTTTPGATLEVNGTTAFDGLASFASGISGTLYVANALGINTTSPGALLDAEAPGTTSGSGSTGVRGVGGTATGSGIGGGAGVQGYGGGGTGSLAYSDGPGGYFVGGDNAHSGDGIDAFAGSGYAGYFTGNVGATGSFTGGLDAVKIDHPLDPANKYLFHASVESSEMMNIYTGNVITDASGNAVVRLPDWFQILNTDFRYQLTVIGQFAQAIVAREIEENHFSIKTNVGNVKVSWQVTCVRQDAYAKAHPLVVEQAKSEIERGYYIHPELYGAPPEKQMEWARHPQFMKQNQVRKNAATLSRSQQ
jgi:trimeric autotransporter adhesin